MNAFEDKINEMHFAAKYPTKDLDDSTYWYWEGYRQALTEALNVFKETSNED